MSTKNCDFFQLQLQLVRSEESAEILEYAKASKTINGRKKGLGSGLIVSDLRIGGSKTGLGGKT